MNKLLFLLGFVFISLHSYSQKIDAGDIKYLQKKEDSLIIYSNKIIQSINANQRFTADSIFTKLLVRALKTPHSFHYYFDSLQTISIMYPPDSSFRIFTWQMVINDNIIRQHGAIQMKTFDGSLKLYPLIDKSDVTTKITDTIGNNKGWIGAVYYKIIQTKNSSQNFYTLLGYDENNIRSTRKIIEVLNFTNDEPIFGARIFSFEQDSVFKSSQSRYVMEFKKNAGARLNYDADLKIIIFEHLISESNQPEKKWTLIPDGDYEGFRWQSGKWIHIEKIFTQKTPEGQEPVPMPIKDASGKTIENNLK